MNVLPRMYVRAAARLLRAAGLTHEEEPFIAMVVDPEMIDGLNDVYLSSSHPVLSAEQTNAVASIFAAQFDRTGDGMYSEDAAFLQKVAHDLARHPHVPRWWVEHLLATRTGYEWGIGRDPFDAFAMNQHVDPDLIERAAHVAYTVTPGRTAIRYAVNMSAPAAIVGEAAGLISGRSGARLGDTFTAFNVLNHPNMPAEKAPALLRVILERLSALTAVDHPISSRFATLFTSHAVDPSWRWAYLIGPEDRSRLLVLTATL